MDSKIAIMELYLNLLYGYYKIVKRIDRVCNMDKKMNEIIREQRKKTKSYSRAIG